MTPRVLRGHRVYDRRRSMGWRERRRRADRIAREAPQYRQPGGRWASVPEERLPIAEFTVTPEMAFGQPGALGDPLRYAIHLPRETPAEFVPVPVRNEDADAA